MVFLPPVVHLSVKERNHIFRNENDLLYTFELDAWVLSRGFMRHPKAMHVRTRHAVIRMAYSQPSAVISLGDDHIYSRITVLLQIFA